MNRPPPYKFPDPVAWEALHGLKPYALANVPAFLAINATAAIQQAMGRASQGLKSRMKLTQNWILVKRAF